MLRIPESSHLYGSTQMNQDAILLPKVYSTSSEAETSQCFSYPSSIQNFDFEYTALRVVKLPKHFSATDRQLDLAQGILCFKSEQLIPCHTLGQRHQWHEISDKR